MANVDSPYNHNFQDALRGKGYNPNESVEERTKRIQDDFDRCKLDLERSTDNLSRLKNRLPKYDDPKSMTFSTPKYAENYKSPYHLQNYKIETSSVSNNKTPWETLEGTIQKHKERIKSSRKKPKAPITRSSDSIPELTENYKKQIKGYLENNEGFVQTEKAEMEKLKEARQESHSRLSKKYNNIGEFCPVSPKAAFQAALKTCLPEIKSSILISPTKDIENRIAFHRARVEISNSPNSPNSSVTKTEFVR